MRFKIINKKLEVHYSIFDIGASWDYDFIPAYEFSMDHIDDYFTENGENISSVMLEISKGREFMLLNAYQLAKIINENNPKNRIDWKATFRCCNLEEYNPNGWQLKSPMKEIVAKGYGAILKCPDSNSYMLLKGNPSEIIHPEAISLSNNEVMDIFVLETMGVVDISYEILFN